MGLFRCRNESCAENLGPHPEFDFEADLPVCPKCQADGRQEPGAVTERACIHYLVNDAAGPIRTANGRRLVACRPGMKQFPPHATGHHSAVTCPECKKTAVFQSHEAADADQHRDIVKFTPAG